MGMSVEEIRGLKGVKLVKLPVGDYKYQLYNPPKRHSQFIKYFVFVTPKHGLYTIIAQSGEIATSAYGYQLKESYKEIKGRLKRVYGTFEEINSLDANSSWDLPRHFMMGLWTKERTLGCVWKPKRDKIKFATLMVSAESSTSGSLALGIEFINVTEARVWKKAKEDDAF